MGLREQNKRAKEQRIIAAGRRLFRERGFERTTMRELAKEAGVGVGTLYQYARDKVAIAELISREDLEGAMGDAMASLPTSGLHAQLMHVFGVFFDVHRKNRDIARIMIRELSVAADADRDARAARFNALFALLGELVASAQARGEIGDEVEPLEVAVAAFGLHYFVLVAWLADNGMVPKPEPILARQLELLLLGM